MINSRTVGGIHRPKPEDNKYTEEELLLLKNKDMGYILQSIQSEKKKIEKLGSTLHELDNKPQNKHVYFAEDGGYEFGYSTAMGGSGAVSGLEMLGISLFLKSGTTGGDEKPSGGIFAGILVTLIAFLSTEVFRHKASKKRQGYFEQHGGRTLLRILETDDNNITFTLYDRGDLAKATRGFHKANIVGEGAHGTVYKANLGSSAAENASTTVAVKRCKQIDRSRTDGFVQELVVLCRVSHPNVVRLLGCCFHFEAPMLVYEFVPNGTLSDLLHGKPRRRVTLPTRLKRPWRTCTRHRTRRSTATVQVVPKGTLAYLDPEFLQDHQITDKKDVYSFGVVLIELLTRKNPQAKEWKNLTVMFQSSTGNGTLGDLLDADIVEEGSMGLIYAAAKLVSRCIAVPGNARPAMGQVAGELRRLSDQMPESPEVRVALEVEDGRYSYAASTEGETTRFSNLTKPSTAELAR
uniref:Protein kinase domain-containing protein n=1 Tax=Zea mays TaxID=4577 RepID=A0A804PR15_MAIZE